MTLAASSNNYEYGAGKLYFKTSGGTGYLEIGNCPVFEINMEPEERIEHWESQTDEKLKDVDDVLKWSVSANITMEEYSAENIDIAFRGDGVQSLGNQAASYIDDDSTTTVASKYMDLGYTDLSYVKLSHGDITSGPFTEDEQITGGTSGATGNIPNVVTTTYLEVVNIAVSTFQVGETVTGAGGASAVVTAVETINGAIVMDEATGSARLVEGTDYSIDPVGGLIRELTDGSIAANTCFVSANYAAKTNKSIRALAGSQKNGELLFVGNPRRGPRWRVSLWNCNINLSGAVPLITEEAGQITLEVAVLSDSSSHPNEPYFRATEAS